ncbi:MAG: fused response regulator/phosphatase [Pseudomonadota bacterium]
MTHDDTSFGTLPSNCDRLRVLVVDDSAAQRRLMSAVLKRLDLDVVSAASAEAALSLCATPGGQDIGMILSDWQMPGMDGPTFCKEFRGLDRSNYTYFVLMTSETDRSAKAKGLEAGADDFLTRPVDLAELRARIRAGRRILRMQEQLIHRNHEVQTAYADLQSIHDAIARDLVEARRLQRAFLPPRHHKAGASELNLSLLACNQIGGDLVGYFPLPGDAIALFSIDVSGHGIASALLTGRLSGLFSSRSRARNIAFRADGTVIPPDQVMGHLNDFMLQELASDIYFTAVLAYVDLSCGQVVLCQAGHPHPLVRSADGTVVQIGEGGPPVGLIEGTEFDAVTFQLHPGDALLAYSDGLTECTDTWGDMLEEEGLMSLLASISPEAEDVIAEIEGGLRAHVGINGFDDDVSMLLLRYDRPKARAMAAR